MKDDDSKEKWGQYFNMLMNEANLRVETEEIDPSQAMTRNIREEETESALKRDDMWESSRSRRNTS